MYTVNKFRKPAAEYPICFDMNGICCFYNEYFSKSDELLKAFADSFFDIAADCF